MENTTPLKLFIRYLIKRLSLPSWFLRGFDYQQHEGRTLYAEILFNSWQMQQLNQGFYPKNLFHMFFYYNQKEKWYIQINFIISLLVTVNCQLFLSQLAYLLACSTSNSTMSMEKLSNISHSVSSDNSGCMFKSFRETFSLVTSSKTTLHLQ